VSGKRRGPRLPAAVGADTSVFINCPYDDADRPLADAIVLAAAACGFTARSAIETGSVSAPRIERIRNALSISRYSIYDLNRCRVSRFELLPRRGGRGSGSI
jgi:hypothetical protein